MGLGARFAKLMRQEQRMHAVWPLTASLAAVGDYGAFDDGVFVPLGRIDEFGVKFGSAETSADDFIQVRSSGTTIMRLEAGAPVAAFTPGAKVDAKLSIRCEDEYSFWFRAKGVTAREMSNKNEVARALSNAIGWKRGLFRWTVVGKVYSCNQYFLLGSRVAKTTFELRGRADVLSAFDSNQELGATLETQTNKAMALEQRGHAGPIGLELFRVSLFGSEAVHRRGTSDGEEVTAEAVLEDGWSHDYPTDWS